MHTIGCVRDFIGKCMPRNSATTASKRTPGNGLLVLLLLVLVCGCMYLGFAVGLALGLPSLIFLGVVVGAAIGLWITGRVDRNRASSQPMVTNGSVGHTTRAAIPHNQPTSPAHLPRGAAEPADAPADMVITATARTKRVCVVVEVILVALTLSLVAISPNAAILVAVLAILWLVVMLNAIGQLITCSPAGLFARYRPGEGRELRFSEITAIGRMSRSPWNSPNGLIIQSSGQTLHLPEFVLSRPDYRILIDRLLSSGAAMSDAAYYASVSSLPGPDEKNEIR